MAKPPKFQAIRGTRDLLPPETALWNRVEENARHVFGTFGFGEIRPPVFEPTELFARAVGGETDIVSKEMYTFFEGRVIDFPENFYQVEEAISEARKRGEIPDSTENLAQITKALLIQEKIRGLVQTSEKN